MAKPNYSFEKRQREIAKKKKKEQKLAKKQPTREGGGEAEDPGVAHEAPADGTTPAPQD